MKKLIDKIMQFFYDRGFCWTAFAPALHIFGSLLLVIFLKTCGGIDARKGAILVFLFGVIKESLDFWLCEDDFSLEDIGYNSIGILFGLLFCS